MQKISTAAPPFYPSWPHCATRKRVAPASSTYWTVACWGRRWEGPLQTANNQAGVCFTALRSRRRRWVTQTYASSGLKIH